jgi:hypothetical protein
MRAGITGLLIKSADELALVKPTLEVPYSSENFPPRQTCKHSKSA